jgi:short-chain Z-isoprenyl diphosphate synthase
MALSDLLYGAYERRLAASVRGDRIPRHVGVILDGNRRWAKMLGEKSDRGHQAGADKVAQFVTWCDEAGVEVVTLWMLSTDNLDRPEAELAPLIRIIEQTVTDLAITNKWRVNPVGALDLLPPPTAQLLKSAAEATSTLDGLIVNVAVGYGGRREITDAVRSLLSEHATRGTSIEELAEVIDIDHSAEHLYTRGQPDPDLVIRTSGEQRLSGFLLWQSAHSEFYFCEAYWPDFRRIDFLRALRDFGARSRRFGS